MNTTSKLVVDIRKKIQQEKDSVSLWQAETCLIHNSYVSFYEGKGSDSSTVICLNKLP